MVLSLRCLLEVLIRLGSMFFLECVRGGSLSEAQSRGKQVWSTLPPWFHGGWFYSASRAGVYCPCGNKSQQNLLTAYSSTFDPLLERSVLAQLLSIRADRELSRGGSKCNFILVGRF